MKQNKKNAFTMIELLVVTTIIAILIAVGTVSYSSVSRKSRDSKRRSDIAQIRAALEMYRSDNAGYPNNESLLIPDYLSVWPIAPKSGVYTYTPSCSPVCYTYKIETELEITPVPDSVCTLTGSNNYCLPNP